MNGVDFGGQNIQLFKDDSQANFSGVSEYFEDPETRQRLILIAVLGLAIGLYYYFKK